MFNDSEITQYRVAISDFRRARSQAKLKELLARLLGESTRLLSFDEVRKKLKLHASIDRGYRDIPLDAIVGSVGRYNDFTRQFLPRQEVDAERWARVKAAVSGLKGLPPIEVYQIGEVYFVRDGNHRVSVARQIGATHIQAYVTEVQSRVALTPDIQLDELILKAEYVNFLEATNLDKVRPEADLSVTAPGNYQVFLEHIEVHRYFMGLDFQREISWDEAVSHWYDTIYMPMINIIRESALLHRFPERSEADLYLWIVEHRTHLEQQLGWEIKNEYALDDITNLAAANDSNLFSRFSGSFRKIILLDKLDAGPPTGRWRTLMVAPREDENLFPEILVPVNGREDGWCALEQALVVALREDSKLRGLHVVPKGEDSQESSVLEVQDRFERRCQESGIEGKLFVASGEIAPQICRASRVTDLIVTNLSHPPAPQPLARLSSGFRNMIQSCPRPILASPQIVTSLNDALLAFDGSSKAREALYVSAYLACKWEISLLVVIVPDGENVTTDTLEEARQYFNERGLQPHYIFESGNAADVLLTAAEEYQRDFMIMGGYGFNPLIEVVMGSTVDQVLRESQKPILICR